jgi:hypothetical protein
MEQGEQRRIANMLNCRMGELPMKYLGLPIRDIKLGREDFVELPGKIAKRIPPMEGEALILTGRDDIDKCMPIKSAYIHNGILLAGNRHS